MYLVPGPGGLVLWPVVTVTSTVVPAVPDGLLTKIWSALTTWHEPGPPPGPGGPCAGEAASARSSRSAFVLAGVGPPGPGPDPHCTGTEPKLTAVAPLNPFPRIRTPVPPFSVP